MNSGEKICVDEETQRLLNYANFCWQESGGMFDITSGVLRKVWKFSGAQSLPPETEALNALLPRIGWEKVHWQPPSFQLPEGMEVDFGGIGKEYAVDQALLKAKQKLAPQACVLINFGGDIAVCSGENALATPWQVGIEQPDHDQAMAAISLSRGALATSGDARRYVMIHGERYGHILNPKTGWPIKGAPRSVTVLSSTCIEAGTMATIAMLQGSLAEVFLADCEVRSWCVR